MAGPTAAYADILQTMATFYGLDPEVIDIDVFTMMGTWAGAASASSANPAAYQFEVGYDHIIWGLTAFISNPTDNPANFTRVEFNIFNTFENKTMWQKPLNCGMFFQTTGAPERIYDLPAFKKFPDRTTLQVQFSPSQFDNTWAGAVKNIGVMMFGAKVNAKIMAAVEAQKAAQGG